MNFNVLGYVYKHTHNISTNNYVHVVLFAGPRLSIVPTSFLQDQTKRGKVNEGFGFRYHC